MKTTKTREARQLLKERFDYLIFLYQADFVGISATGEPDRNELYPNETWSADSGETCLEAYLRFLSDPSRFETRV